MSYTRRNFLRMAGLSGAGLALAACATQQAAVAPTAVPAVVPTETAVTSPDQALQRLMEGNKRFTEFKLLHPNETKVRLDEVAKGQQPFASILGCADSRVGPEVIFDRGLGDLFVVRSAGNIADPVAIGSLEFSVAVLGSPLILVLGHERCGAVSAAVKGDLVPGFIAEVIKDIQPAVEKSKGQQGDAVENAIVENVKLEMEKLKSQSEILAGAIKEGKIKIIGGVYDLDTGAITMVA